MTASPDLDPAAADPAGEAPPEMPRYGVGEEIANALTHGVGAVLAVSALVLMTVYSGLYGDAWHVVSSSVFGATLVLLYLASTLYHAVTAPRAKRLLRLLDHGAIFLLIAGTYTPFTLVSLRGPWGWSLFGVVWGLALVGVFFQAGLLRRWEFLRVGLYVAMGWVVVIAIKPLIASMELGGLLLLLGGGLAYTLGIVFYAWERLPFSHAVWHVFVLAGSCLHFFSVFFYVIPPAVGR